MVETLLFLPVAAKDVDRAVNAVRSIRKYCERYRIYLLLDGADPSVLSAELAGDDIRVRVARPPSKGHWGLIWLAQARAMIEANSEPDIAPDAIFVRMDSDALVIREGFPQRARAIFSTRPAAGQIGQIFTTIRGARFANAGWFNFIAKTMGWRGLRQFVRCAWRRGESAAAGMRGWRDFRAMVKGASRTGYVYGEICLGGCNIVRRELVARMAERMSTDNSPFRFLPGLGDDLVMTIVTYWLGYAPMDDASDGGICGIETRELRVDPFVLRQRGHYVIHSLKYGHKGHGHDLSEAQLVAALLEP